MKNIIFLLSLFILASSAYAHRSGCHRWHSCPSDRGTYICGDVGYCSGCPNNQYCKNGLPVTSEGKNEENISSDIINE